MVMRGRGRHGRHSQLEQNVGLSLRNDTAALYFSFVKFFRSLPLSRTRPRHLSNSTHILPILHFNEMVITKNR